MSRRTEKELFGTSFFDMITCGLGGAMLLLFVIAAMVRQGGTESYEVKVADGAENYYRVIAEFNSTKITIEPEPKKNKDYQLTVKESGNKFLILVRVINEDSDKDLNIIFSGGGSSTTCEFTAISPINVTNVPEDGSTENCFKADGTFEIILEKTEKFGLKWQE